MLHSCGILSRCEINNNNNNNNNAQNACQPGLGACGASLSRCEVVCMHARLPLYFALSMDTVLFCEYMAIAATDDADERGTELLSAHLNSIKSATLVGADVLLPEPQREDSTAAAKQDAGRL